ncbi:ground-like domain-containing protein [Ditylenchus destructor]|nr:ground-like domain-containing protein [Ditylenchus destructor]
MNFLIALFYILAAVTCELVNACDENKAGTESTCSKYLAARPEGRSETCSLRPFRLPISELEAIPECRALMDFVGWRGGEAGNVENGQLWNESTPCKNTRWKSIMQAHITDGNATASANDIQAALQGRHPGRAFAVKCSEKKENDKPTIVHQMPRGYRYCAVIKNNVWCLAISTRKMNAIKL